MDEIEYFIYNYHPLIYCYLYFIEYYFMFLYFIILSQNFFNIKISKLFKQSIKLFKLLFQLILNQF